MVQRHPHLVALAVVKLYYTKGVINSDKGVDATHLGSFIEDMFALAKTDEQTSSLVEGLIKAANNGDYEGVRQSINLLLARCESMRIKPLGFDLDT